jgi:sugar phosphate isomerase/epimerase
VTLLSLAHGTLLQLPPPELVRLAARSGFGAVGLRIAPWLAWETPYTVVGNARLVAETANALDESGIEVVDVEVIRVEPATRAADFRPFFDAGARLGARYALAVAIDTDEPRAVRNIRELCKEAEQFGLRLVLEIMPHRGLIRTLEIAARVVAATGEAGCGILIDAVHFYRSGGSAGDLRRYDPQLFPYMQIDDVDRKRVVRKPAAPDEEAWTKVLPGLGDLPLVELLRALPAQIPVAVEITGVPMPPAETIAAFAQDAYARTEATVAAAALT